MLHQHREIAELHGSVERCIRRHRALTPHELEAAALRGTLPGDPATNGFSIHATTLALQDKFDRREIRETSTNPSRWLANLDQLTGEPAPSSACG